MIMFLLSGILGLLISLGLMYLYTYTIERNAYMKKQCTNTTTGTFIKFMEKEIRESFLSDTTEYAKYFFPVYEYYVNEKRYEVQSMCGRRQMDESLIEKNKIVYYDPTNPEEAYIKDGSSKEILKSIKILSISFFCVGIIMILMYLVVWVIATTT